MLTTLGKNVRGAASVLLSLVTRAYILYQSAYSCPLAPSFPRTCPTRGIAFTSYARKNGWLMAVN